LNNKTRFGERRRERERERGIVIFTEEIWS
jgi:hypothetical protein